MHGQELLLCSVSPENLTPENIEKFQQAQGQFSPAHLSRLLVTVEQYPNLRANDAFRNLQTQLEGTENRITVARNDFNDSRAGLQYKSAHISYQYFCRHDGLSDLAHGFTADAGSENAPKVDFGPVSRQPSVNFDSTNR